MLTLNKINKGNRNTLEIYGLSSDTPFPIDSIEDVAITNGSTIFLMDTGAVLIFDEENRTWLNM